VFFAFRALVRQVSQSYQHDVFPTAKKGGTPVPGGPAAGSGGAGGTGGGAGRSSSSTGGGAGSGGDASQLAPAPLIPENLLSTSLTLADIDPLEIARQVTVLTFTHYQKIQPFELLDAVCHHLFCVSRQGVGGRGGECGRSVTADGDRGQGEDGRRHLEKQQRECVVSGTRQMQCDGYPFLL